MKPTKLTPDAPIPFGLLETLIVAPKYRRNVPCSVDNYCSRDFCKGRVSGQYGWQCLRENHCHRRGYYFQNEDIPIGFCYHNKCTHLVQSDKGSRIICELFLGEMKRPTAPPSGHTTLRLRWKSGGWVYRKV